MHILTAMFDFSGFTFSHKFELRFILVIFLLTAIVFLLPNTQQIVLSVQQGIKNREFILCRFLTGKITWKPSAIWASFAGGLFIISIIFLERKSEFLYFQF